MTPMRTLIRGVPAPAQYASQEEMLAARERMQAEIRADLIEEGGGCEDCGGSRFVRVTTDRYDPRFGQVKPCACALRQTPADQLIERSGLPERMRDWTLDTYPAMQHGKCGGHAAALRFVEQVIAGEPSFLLLAGPNGAGKTGLAAGIVQALAEAGKVARFASVVALMSGIRDRFNHDGDFLRNTDGELARADARQYEQWHIDAPVLVLDDLIKAKSSGWVQEKMFLWIDQRLHANRSTVITLDASSQAVEDAFGPAVVSRLQQFERVVVQGADLRAGMAS